MRNGKRRVNEDYEGRAIRNKVLMRRAAKSYVLDTLRDMLVWSLSGAAIAIGVFRYFGNA